MKKANRIRIVNKTGMGNLTEVFAVGENGEEVQLPNCRKVTIDPICIDRLVTATVEFSVVDIDIEASLLENKKG